jgi:phage minor structural protein
VINIYDANTIDFNNNGLVVLHEATSCISTQELNKTRSLDLEYPVNKRGKYLEIKGLNIIKAGGQLYRIPLQNNFQADGLSVSVTANHIFYDLNNDFNEDVRADNKSVADALAIAIAVNPKFSVGECDDLGLGTAYFVEESPTEGIYNKILPRWKGELDCDNYVVSVKSRVGRDTGRLISYGKDINGFAQHLNWSNVATRIMPKGKDGLTIDLVNGGSKYLVSPLVNNYPFIITKEIKFDDIEDATELKNAALALWGTRDKPSSNYTIKFVNLEKTEEYKQFEALLVLNIGDSVIIRHEIFEVDLTARVIKIVKDEITDTILEMELGQFKDNINNRFNDMDKQISYNQSNIEEAKSDVKEMKTTVFQNDEEIRLQALAITAVEGRVDDAELLITAEAITATVRSSQEYTDDLGEKITAEQSSTIAQTSSNVKIGFNGISDVVDIDDTGIQVNHTNGDYTHMGASGFKRHVGTAEKDYHYLFYVGQVQIISTSTGMGSAVIQLPDEFKNKNFYVTTSFTGTATADNYAHEFYGFGAFVEGAPTYDKVNARFTIYAHALWDNIGNVKNNISYTVIA